MYVNPIIEYAGIIWGRDNERQKHKLEAPLRFATRLALGLPYSTRDERYLPYNIRLEMCGVLPINDRTKIAQIIFIFKCIRNEIRTDIADIIAERRIMNTRFRRPLLFQTHNLPIDGPLRRMLSTANDYRDAFNLHESTEVTRKKLKDHFFKMQENQNIASIQ